jgi:hypothetical protein
MRSLALPLSTAALLVLGLTASGDRAARAQAPAGFTTTIDNPYWPMRPGTRWVYRETEPGGPATRIVVTVTGRTKRVASGVTARVVHDRATRRGRLVEDTYDWYAQDAEGSVWYLGEDTTAYRRGTPVSTRGSWEAGRAGARAGIAMPAHPQVGQEYEQEFRAGVAEDRGRVLSLDEWVEVPRGLFRNVLMTKDFTRLEPDVLEHKFYARGVGPVLTLDVSGGASREELVSLSRR